MRILFVGSGREGEVWSILRLFRKLLCYRKILRPIRASWKLQRYTKFSLCAQPSYDSPIFDEAQPGGMYDDEFIDRLAVHIVQRMNRGSTGKVRPPVQKKDNTMNGLLLLALLSIIALIPLATILIQGVGGLIGIIAFCAVCTAIISIVGTYGEYLKHIAKYNSKQK